MKQDQDERPSAACVMVAAGAARRMGALAGGRSKAFLRLRGATLLEHACAAFDAVPAVREIVLVVRPEDRGAAEELRRAAPALAKVTAIVPGGPERHDSVRLGLAAVAPESGLVCVHDAARPLVEARTIEAALDAAARAGASLVAVPVADTLKRAEEARAVETFDRARIFAAQTPQCFRTALLRELCERARKDGFRPTDDAALHERYVGPVAIVAGSATNLKITTPDDLRVAEALLAARDAARDGGGSMKDLQRVGVGFDSHRLEQGRRCILGGVELPHPSGPAGHSDGDCVLHALTDALLGAAGLDDLGTLFPDTDERWRGADSARLLALALERVRAAGWRPTNVDLVIATDGPRIAPQRAAMRARIAGLLGLDPDAVNVKGKTLEGLAGPKDAVVAHAVCLLARDH
jgi:2-C-methyl-D-erythritol 4-phosphate cytidylyltransferase/2-C-methyl-D-erythritol 2,4-cyclodiphosphate synthase